MSHIALYRLWRPQTFQDVVGQEHIVQTLHNSLREGRINHAYLFSGPRGTGKTSAARIMAKAINCEQGPAIEPCNECSACVRITAGSVMDVIEIDAASNRRVEETRNLLEQVRYSPTEVRYKVYIIDEVHMLTTEAFNTLLKTLEEPPAHVIFILATTDPNRLPATIISRCQRFDFRRVRIEAQVERLEYICEQENITVEAEALQVIARLSHGGMRDALSLLDQIISYSSDVVTYKQVIAVTGGLDTEQFKQLAEAMKAQDIGASLEYIAELMGSGKSVDRAMESLIQYFRDLLLIKLVPNAEQLTERLLDPAQFSELAEQYDKEQIFSAIDILNHYHVEMKYASQPQTLFEIAVLKISTLPTASASSPSVTASSAGASVTDVEGMASSSQRAVSASPVDGEAWRQLVSQVETLTRELAQLKQTGIGAQGAQGSQGGTQGAQGAQSAQRAVGTPASMQTTQQGVQAGTPAPNMQGGLVQDAQDGQVAQSGQSTFSNAVRSQEKWEHFMQGRDGPAYKAVVAKWSQILAEVRKQKITVHAWLVDGEPVAVTEGAILVAFKNEIHCKTTERPANRQLIEQIMQSILGKALALETIMINDWNDMQPTEAAEAAEQPAEQFQLEPEDDQTGKHKQPWINEAIELFGEDLVTIKEDE